MRKKRNTNKRERKEPQTNEKEEEKNHSQTRQKRSTDKRERKEPQTKAKEERDREKRGAVRIPNQEGTATDRPPRHRKKLNRMA